MASAAARRFFLPRSLHPGAWWLWALGLAVAASRSTNPLVLALIIAAACLVVAARRPLAPWALAFRLYLYVAAFIVVIRVLLRIVFNGNGPTVLFTLWEVRLPDWAAGVRLFGAVSAEALVAAFYDGLRLAAIIVCVGAANALANPKRLLAAVPGALYELGTVLVVSLSLFPQLAESVQRVYRARALRSGARKGARGLHGILIPVVTDALDRSLQLAAAMDSRGYGRRTARTSGQRRVTSILLLAGVLAICVGLYGVLDSTSPWLLSTPMLIAGVAIAVLGLRLAGRRTVRTRYRPDTWRAAELVVVACGVLTAVSVIVAGSLDPLLTFPSVYPPAWPQLSLLLVAGLVIGALPAVLTPAPVDGPGSGRRVADRTAVPA